MGTEFNHRREFVRYQPALWGDSGAVSYGKYRYGVEIVDESLSGVGLKVDSRIGFERGQVVKVDNGHFARKARLVHIQPLSEGVVRVGAQWTPDSNYEPV